MKYVVGVAGTPGAGKSTFCKALKEHYLELNRPVKIFNLDAGCEVNLAYIPDWNVTDVIKVSELMKDLVLGPNGALMEAMSQFLDDRCDIVTNEMDKCADETFIILDLPGQVELYTVRDTMKDFYKRVQNSGYRVCNIYMFESTALRQVDFFVAYSTTVSMSMYHMAVPQLNLLSKMDIIFNGPKQQRLEFPFSYYASADSVAIMICIEKDSHKAKVDNKKFHKLTERLAEINQSYALLNYIPFTLGDFRFLAYIRFQIDRALGATAVVKGIRAPISGYSSEENELKDFIESFMEKCVKISKIKDMMN